MKTLNIFIGMDKDEIPAYHTLSDSLIRYSSQPLSISPINRRIYKEVLWRPRTTLESTEFSTARFLVPWASGYRGLSLFMDCDMLCVGDIAELFEEQDMRCAIQVVKKDLKVTATTKMLNAIQTDYAKKCWSAVMLFNNERCKALTPDYVDKASGLTLHQFKWLTSDSQIGTLSKHWQYVIPYDPPEDLHDAKIVHFTEGGPWWNKYKDIPFADEWRSHHKHIVCDP